MNLQPTIDVTADRVHSSKGLGRKSNSAYLHVKNLGPGLNLAQRKLLKHRKELLIKEDSIQLKIVVKTKQKY